MPRQTGIDDLDARLIALFTDQPHVGVLGASRALSVARGTVQARLDRLEERGVIPAFAPTVDPGALASRSRNTPYAGMELTGRVRHTVLAGEPVVIDGEAQR